MKRIVVGVAVVAVLAGTGAGSAHAQPPVSETISVVLPSFNPPAGPPFFGTASGSFTAAGSFSDAGTLSARTLNLAYPAPTVGGLQTFRTLTGGAGTLQLVCTELARVFTDLSAIPNTGSCAVLSGTGEYAAMAGAGKLTGFVNAYTGAASETIVFGAG